MTPRAPPPSQSPAGSVWPMSWGRLGIRLGTPAHVWKVPGLGLSLAQKPHHLACLLERDCVNWGSLEASPRRPGRSVCVSRTIQQREFLYLQAGEPACAVDGPLEWRVQCSRGQKEVHGDIPLNWQSCGNNHHLHVCFPRNSCKPTFVHPCIFYSFPWNEWVGALNSPANKQKCEEQRRKLYTSTYGASST